MNYQLQIQILYAWFNITHNKQRFIISLLTVAFAVSLMFLQVGFRNAYLDSNFEYIKRFNADLVVVNKQRYASFVDVTFDRNRLYAVAKYPGVESVIPLYVKIGTWRPAGDTKQYPIRVLAFDFTHPALQIVDLERFYKALTFPDTVVLDRKFHSPFQITPVGESAELLTRKVHVIGDFELGRVTYADGNLIMSDQNFLRVFSGKNMANSDRIISSLEDVDIGLIKTRPGVNLDQLISQINPLLPTDLEIFTKDQFLQRDRIFLEGSTGIGSIFLIGKLVGFCVGIVIVYSLIYSDLIENYAQYATLKAIGYSNFYLKRMVIIEALILVILGFIPGVMISVFIHFYIENTTGLLMRITPATIYLIALMTLGMGFLSSLIASLKFQFINPADVYE